VGNQRKNKNNTVSTGCPATKTVALGARFRHTEFLECCAVFGHVRRGLGLLLEEHTGIISLFQRVGGGLTRDTYLASCVVLLGHSTCSSAFQFLLDSIFLGAMMVVKRSSQRFYLCSCFIISRNSAGSSSAKDCRCSSVRNIFR